MNTKKFVILFALFISMIETKTFAFDILVQNADGVTIFYNYINDGTELEVTWGDEYKGDIVIPEQVTFMDRTRKVTSIGENAFKGNYKVLSIIIPNSVTIIGENAFSGCVSMGSITIGSGVKSIGMGALHECGYLKKIIIKDIASWCNIDFAYAWADFDFQVYHFYSDENTEIIDLTIPEGVTSIGRLAFSSTNIKTVTLPNSVTSIGESAFAFCDFLSSISLPNRLVKIENNAFYDCYSISSLTIPNSVTYIGDGAFRGCQGLKAVTIPNAVTYIGEQAFDGWNLPIVVSKIDKPFAIVGKMDYKRTFSQNTFNNATLYVPLGTISDYKTTEGWKDFLFIEEGLPTGINNVGDKIIKEKKRYTIDGKIIYSPQKGINIIQMENGTIQKRIIK
jgi:hypothetical protein